MVLEKGAERVPVWKSFIAHAAMVPKLIQRILQLGEGTRALSMSEQCLHVQFLIVAFAGLEVDVVRQVRLRRSNSCHHHIIRISFLLCYRTYFHIAERASSGFAADLESCEPGPRGA